jgi:predicted Zn-dependent peptidase
MVVVASGNVNEKFFLESVKDKFSDIKHKVKPTHLEAKWIGGFKGEDRDLEQTQLVFGIEGLNTIDVDRYALRALAIILGGGMSSRLFQELREKRGLCYSIFSFTQMQSSSGVFGFYAGTSPKDGNELLEASLCEWNKLKGSISEDEVLRAKAQMRSGFIMGQESTGSRAEYLAKNILTFGKLKSTEQVLREIDKVSVNSVEEVIARIFSVSKPVLSVIGPDAISYKGFNINSSIN